MVRGAPRRPGTLIGLHMPSSARFLNQLSSAMAPLGEISVEGAGWSARVVLSTTSGRHLRFEGNLGDLHRAVQKTNADGLWPGEDASSLDVKLRLFSVHLYEAIATAPEGARRLRFQSYGVVAV